MSLRSYLEAQGTKRADPRQGGVTKVQRACNASRRAHCIQLRDALFERVSAEKVAYMLADDAERAQREVRAVLEQLMQSATYTSGNANSDAELVREVAHMVLGLGPLEDLLAAPEVTEIMVNGPHSVFYEQEGKLCACAVNFYDERQLRMVIDRIIGPLGRRVDEQSPLVSARLAEGHRVNVVIAPLALEGPVLTIRKFPARAFTLDELITFQSLDAPLAQLLRWAVHLRRNIAVSGGTGSGKTTLLNALSIEIAHNERIITIEDAAELHFSEHPHVVRLEARPRNAEGSGEVSIRELVINALRMRPDRIIVGECRGAEALDMLQAMNTGHEGSLTTLHANSPHEVIERLVMMARYAMNLPVSLIEKQISSAFDLVVQLDRQKDGSRRITSVCACDDAYSSDRGVVLQELVTWNTDLQRYQWQCVPCWLSLKRTRESIDQRAWQAWCDATGLSLALRDEERYSYDAC
jgi:pilus assembly protein CpaF